MGPTYSSRHALFVEPRRVRVLRTPPGRDRKKPPSKPQPVPDHDQFANVASPEAVARKESIVADPRTFRWNPNSHPSPRRAVLDDTPGRAFG